MTVFVSCVVAPPLASRPRNPYDPSMCLHPYIWQNYRETSAGRKAIDFFSRFGELLANESSEELVEFVNAQYYEPIDPER